MIVGPLFTIQRALEVKTHSPPIVLTSVGRNMSISCFLFYQLFGLVLTSMAGIHRGNDTKTMRTLAAKFSEEVDPNATSEWALNVGTASELIFIGS